MMKKLTLILIVLATLAAGCIDERENPKTCIECQINSMNKEGGELFLAEIFKSLKQISQSVTCTDASQWHYVAVGSKACGGPTGYLPYHPSIIVKDFLEQVENYTLAQKAFNKKWGIISDCSVVLSPAKVECVDGKAVLVK